MLGNMIDNFHSTSTRPDLIVANGFETTMIVSNQVGQKRLALIATDQTGHYVTLQAAQLSNLGFRASFFGGERPLQGHDAHIVANLRYDQKWAIRDQAVHRGTGVGINYIVRGVTSELAMYLRDTTRLWRHFTYGEIASIIQIMRH